MRSISSGMVKRNANIKYSPKKKEWEDVGMHVRDLCFKVWEYLRYPALGVNYFLFFVKKKSTVTLNRFHEIQRSYLCLYVIMFIQERMSSFLFVTV